jgi:hypothetical protein
MRAAHLRKEGILSKAAAALYRDALRAVQTGDQRPREELTNAKKITTQQKRTANRTN